MTTIITRTFNLSLSSATTATVAEVLHLREMVFDSDERVAVFLEGFYVSLHLPSFQLGKYPDYDGDENDAEIVSKYTASEIASQKIGLRILGRKNNTGNWKEKAEVILLNRGRKQYYDFLTPYLAKTPIRLLERTDALAIQLVDYGNGLLKLNDFIEIDCAVRVEVSKKNDLDALTNRMEALEAALTNFVDLTSNETITGTKTFSNNVIAKNLPNLAIRSNAVTVPFNANVALSAFSETKWIDGAQTNLNVPNNSGNLISIDPLFNTAIAGNYITQEFNNSGGRWWKRDENNGVWSAWKEVAFLEGIQTFTGNKTFGGFTTFGDNVAIKIKRITGTTAATQGGIIQIPHGLVGDKIIGMVVKVSHGTNQGVPADFDTHTTGYSYEQWHDATNINYQNHPTNSINILSKPFSVLIFYIN